MYYITVKQPPMYHQMTLEEFLFGSPVVDYVISHNQTNTRTYETEKINSRFKSLFKTDELIGKLTDFNKSTESLREAPRESLYNSFSIPKKSGGLRQINAPNPELMTALRNLKTIFETDFGALYHTNAFAYIKHRSTIDLLKRHQSNNSKWMAKADLHNFFGSTSLEFVMKMFGMIFPFCEVINDEIGRKQLEKALELAFLDGGLPQGTPISPIITNVMMIPIDFTISKRLRTDDRFKDQTFVYTRYADDFQISSRYYFDYKETENLIMSVCEEFGAPFTLNQKKTRYGSTSGRNWNLGLMLNKDNQITVGHKRKRQFKAMLTSYALDRKNGKPWDISDIQTLEGYRNYYRMVERENIDEIVTHISNKFDINIRKAIKEDLQSLC